KSRLTLSIILFYGLSPGFSLAPGRYLGCHVLAEKSYTIELGQGWREVYTYFFTNGIIGRDIEALIKFHPYIL
mgnify:CR=1